MKHKLYDITFYRSSKVEFENKFALKQNLISDLYIQFLNGYKPPKTTRITVQLTDKDLIHGYCGSSILAVEADFDEEKFETLTDKEQSRTILETIHRIAMLCANNFGWDKEIFEQAYKQVLQVDFIYSIEGKPKNSKNRNNKAAILLEKNEICSTISVVFYDKSGRRLKTVELFKSFQHELFYGNIFKMQKWFNDSEFGLYYSNEELTIKASLEKDVSETTIKPVKTDKAELEGLLRRITYHDIKSQEDLAEWMNK